MGKSYLINIIRDQLWKIAKNNNINAQSPVLIFTSTGVVTFNIYSIMIYFTPSILISCNNLDLNDEHLKNYKKN